jgi:hypothetical protein
MSSARHDHLMRIVKRLPTDYAVYAPEGQGVERWADPNLAYPDCSGGCRWNNPLFDRESDRQDFDWLVCMHPTGPRRGLLTFEHQAGFGCFEPTDDNDDE